MIDSARVRSSIAAGIELIERARVNLMIARGFQSVEDTITFLGLLQVELKKQLENIPIPKGGI